ncbi:hypothetical protein [Paucibacter sp. DJ2R-2]|uniref:hypothetical protein n=1 Tax=Paucibacter sp. DJ2R-2 TaxID=2893558 RepID=UPI0021E3B920|nr:hypothetical protein [Paucibacter sp. DJ2R-2]MCV2438167.1 hypothetical protein [Paucibacter sp. DJ2R-2]
MTLVAPRVSPRTAQKRKAEQHAIQSTHLQSKKHYLEEKRHAAKNVLPHKKSSAQVEVARESGFLRVTILVPESAAPVGRVTSKMHLPGSLQLKNSVVRLVNALNDDDKRLNLAQMAERLEAAASPDNKSEKVRTKSAQSTIGVTSSKELRELIGHEAQKLGIPLAEAARRAFERGFQILEDRLWEESSAVVSKDFEDYYGRYSSVETIQWSLRVARNTYVRAVVIARERGISQSALACWCLSYKEA